MSLTRALVLACLATPSIAVVAHWPDGNAECPCINPWESRRLLPSEQTPRPGCDLTRASDGHCFNASYGSNGCAAYDLHAPECLYAPGRPPWCADMWCFVDEQACKRGYRPSAYFPSNGQESAESESASGGLTDGSSLHYSYQTCGYVDFFTDSTSAFAAQMSAVAASTPNAKLRIGFPGDSASMYTIVGTRPYPDGSPKVVAGSGVGGTNRSGAVVVLVANLLTQLSVPWEETAISARSLEYSPASSFTACVHEVAIGNLDLCIGNFWPTARRRTIANFASPIYRDSFHLIVPYAPPGAYASIWRSLQAPFTPFSAELWLMIFVILGLVGLMGVNAERTKIPTWYQLLAGAPTAIFKGCGMLPPCPRPKASGLAC